MSIPVPIFQHASASTARVLGRKGVRVVFQGDKAETDGETVIIPALDLNKDLSDNEADIIRGYIDHEAGHVKHTDFSAWTKAIEEAQKRNDKLFAVTLNALEDMRLERKVLEEYPGSSKHLRATGEAVNEAFKEKFGRDTEALKDWGKVGPYTITMAGRKRMGTIGPVGEKLLKKVAEPIAKKADEWAALVEHCNSTKDVIELAKRVCKELADEAAKDSGTPPEAAVATPGKAVEGEYNVSDTELSDERDRNGGGGAGAEGIGRTTTAQEVMRRLMNDPIEIDMGEAITKSLRSAARMGSDSYIPFTISEDKWHTRHDQPGKYKGWSITSDPTQPQYDYTLGPTLAHRVNDIRYRDAADALVGNIGVMKRKLERALQAKLNREWDGGKLYGRLDTRRLVAAVQGSQNVYKLRTEAPDLDTAAVLLIDLSGSMIGREIQLAQQATIALAEVFDKVGVPFAVHGFKVVSGVTNPDTLRAFRDAKDKGHKYSRWSPIDMIEFKDFDDNMRVARRALGSIVAMAGGNNCDGESVMYSYQRLAKRREQKKIMLVLSDGMPATDSSYPGHLAQHLRNVVAYIERQPGTHLVGIGIQSDAVQRFYSRYTVLHCADDLTKTTMDHISRLILGERFQIDNRELLEADHTAIRAGR